MSISIIKEARNYAKDEFLASQFLNKNKHSNEYNENSASLDADILLSHILKKNRAWILSHYDEDFSAHNEDFLKLVKKRASGLPIAYITGIKEFYGRDFFVSPAVLIPKPDTEVLVEEALYALKDKMLASNEEISVLDICTGSGCIGLALLAELPKIKLVLGDISEKALEICKKNAENLLSKESLDRLSIRKIDLVNDDFGGSYDIITANPPYVPSKLTDALLEDGRSEPRLALDGGEDGLILIPALAHKIKQSLKPDGRAFVEVGEYHAQKACDIFKNTGFSSVQIKKDLSGKARMLEISK